MGVVVVVGCIILSPFPQSTPSSSFPYNSSLHVDGLLVHVIDEEAYTHGPLIAHDGHADYTRASRSCTKQSQNQDVKKSHSEQSLKGYALLLLLR